MPFEWTTTWNAVKGVEVWGSRKFELIHQYKVRSNEINCQPCFGNDVKALRRLFKTVSGSALRLADLYVWKRKPQRSQLESTKFGVKARRFEIKNFIGSKTYRSWFDRSIQDYCGRLSAIGLAKKAACNRRCAELGRQKLYKSKRFIVRTVYSVSWLLLRSNSRQQFKSADTSVTEFRGSAGEQRHVWALQFKFNHACLGTELEPAIHKPSGQSIWRQVVWPAGRNSDGREQRDT